LGSSFLLSPHPKHTLIYSILQRSRRIHEYNPGKRALGTNNNGTEIKDITDALKYFSADLMDNVVCINNNAAEVKDVGASDYHITVRPNNNAVSTKYKGAGIKDVEYITKKKGVSLNNVGDRVNYLV